MPLKRLVHGQPPSVDLCNRLVSEWQAPDDSHDEPIIVQDEQSPLIAGLDPILHVYVIWEEWAPYSQIERSEIIMNAAEQVLGLAASSITVALGLTAAEAI